MIAWDCCTLSDRTRYLYMRPLSVGSTRTVVNVALQFSYFRAVKKTWRKGNDRAGDNRDKYQQRRRVACEGCRKKKREEVWGAGRWKGVKARVREKTSFCLTQQRPYFILCAVNQLEASEQTGRESAGGREGVSKRGNKPGGKKGSGPVGRHRAIDPGLTVRGTDVDTDRCVVQYGQPFSLIYSEGLCIINPSPLPPHTSFSHIQALNMWK